MAIIIKQKVSQDREGERVWITDITGEHNDPDNLGGYGVDNPNLNTLCIVSVIGYNHSEGVQYLDFVGSQFIYDGSASNDKETLFEALYKNDGWHSANLCILPVSQNQNQDINSNQLNVGDYFLYTDTNKIHVKTGDSLSEEVEDINTVITAPNVQLTLCEEFLQSKLLIFREQEYAEYRRERTAVCAPSALFNEIREVTEDIISSEYTFRSGLKVEAQDQIELILDEKNLI